MQYINVNDITQFKCVCIYKLFFNLIHKIFSKINVSNIHPKDSLVVDTISAPLLK